MQKGVCYSVFENFYFALSYKGMTIWHEMQIFFCSCAFVSVCRVFAHEFLCISFSGQWNV